MSLLGLVPSRRDDDTDAAIYDHQINLVDHTKSDDGTKSPSDLSSGTQTPLSSKPSRRLHRASIREDLAKRGLARQKYAKWQQDRFESFDEGSAAGETGLVQIDSRGAQLRSEETDQTIDTSSRDDSELSRKKSKLERGKNRVKGLVSSRKVIKQSKEENAVVDVLYENQRGSFFFGVPLFSAKSLLNFDPAAWVDGRFKPTPVDITNAAVPDPSWDWAWPSWYVDMSHDVDEEGWEYSFSFRHGFAWHGTHPWFHSFVRRRRWLRKRVRKHLPARNQPDPKNFSDAHMLNSEYFSIHPPKNQPNMSLARSGSPTRFGGQDLEEEEEEDDISTMARLIARLTKASIDRERIILVRRFLDEGGEELHYLAEQVYSFIPSVSPICHWLHFFGLLLTLYRCLPSCHFSCSNPQENNYFHSYSVDSRQRLHIARPMKIESSQSRLLNHARSTISSTPYMLPMRNVVSSNTGVTFARSQRMVIRWELQIRVMAGGMVGMVWMTAGLERRMKAAQKDSKRRVNLPKRKMEMA